jgi:hypothetical protein
MTELRIVAERSDKDIARHNAAADMSWPLRVLAANLLRIIRGAGKPDELEGQCENALAAMQAYLGATGNFPRHDIAEPLRMSTRRSRAIGAGRATEADIERWNANGENAREDALETICRGALQMVASGLVGQLPQENAGESEIYRGLVVIEELREANRRAAVEAARVPRRTRRKSQ